MIDLHQSKFITLASTDLSLCKKIFVQCLSEIKSCKVSNLSYIIKLLTILYFVISKNSINIKKKLQLFSYLTELTQKDSLIVNFYLFKNKVRLSYI